MFFLSISPHNTLSSNPNFFFFFHHHWNNNWSTIPSSDSLCNIGYFVWIFVYRVEKSNLEIKIALFIELNLLIVSILSRLWAVENAVELLYFEVIVLNFIVY